MPPEFDEQVELIIDDWIEEKHKTMETDDAEG